MSNLLHKGSGLFNKSSLFVCTKHDWDDNILNNLIHQIFEDFLIQQNEGKNPKLRSSFINKIEIFCPLFIKYLLFFPQGVNLVSEYFVQHSSDFYDHFEGGSWLNLVQCSLMFHLSDDVRIINCSKMEQFLSIQLCYEGSTFHSMYSVYTNTCWYLGWVVNNKDHILTHLFCAINLTCINISVINGERDCILSDVILTNMVECKVCCFVKRVMVRKCGHVSCYSCYKQSIGSCPFCRTSGDKAKMVVHLKFVYAKNNSIKCRCGAEATKCRVKDGQCFCQGCAPRVKFTFYF